jgi:hypothetical protein
MRWLHGSDHLQTRESRKVGHRDHLSVFNTVAAVAWTIGFGDSFEYIDCYAIGAVTDGRKI